MRWCAHITHFVFIFRVGASLRLRREWNLTMNVRCAHATSELCLCSAPASPRYGCARMSAQHNTNPTLRDRTNACQRKSKNMIFNTRRKHAHTNDSRNILAFCVNTTHGWDFLLCLIARTHLGHVHTLLLIYAYAATAQHTRVRFVCVYAFSHKNTYTYKLSSTACATRERNTLAAFSSEGAYVSTVRCSRAVARAMMAPLYNICVRIMTMTHCILMSLCVYFLSSHTHVPPLFSAALSGANFYILTRLCWENINACACLYARLA